MFKLTVVVFCAAVFGLTRTTSVLPQLIQEAEEQNYKDESSDLLLNMYRRLESGEDMSSAAGHTTNNSLKAANTVRSFAILGGEKDAQHHFRINASQLINHSDRITLVELRFRSEDLSLTTKIRLRAVLVKGGHTIVKQRKFGLKSGVRFYKDQKDGFHCLDITTIVKRWYRKIRQNDILELVMERVPVKATRQGHVAATRHGHRRRRSVQKLPLIVVFAQNESFLSKRLHNSMLTMKTEATKKLIRHKRNTRRRQSNKWRRLREKKRPCKPRDFMVDFEAIGWGAWIVHPKRFNAKLCYGMCHDPLTHDYNPSNHAVMQSLMRIQGEVEVPRTCCVPTKLQPLSMLYYDQDQISLRHHEDLVVSECGCQ